MHEKDYLAKLINEPQKPNLSEWVYNVEEFLESIHEQDKEAWTLIDGIKQQGAAFHRCDNLVALLKVLYRRKYDNIALPPIKKRNQIFVAMMFSTETDRVYENVYRPTISSLNYTSMRIDEKEFNGSIIDEIKSEISDSVALIADLTGNRGGVYYEAGIAKGLQMCNHPIKLILTCERGFFNEKGVHFDVKGDNFILYDNDEDLKQKLANRLSVVLRGDNQ